MKTQQNIVRSALYLPASNGRAVEKAATLPADAIIFDLEDAVSVEHKADARSAACAAVQNGGAGESAAVIRINELDTPWGNDDLAAALVAIPDAVLVPKVNSARDIEALSQRMTGHNVELWVMIETARSILNIQQIADVSLNTPLTCFVIGTNDLAKETRMGMDNNREALVPSLTQSVLAARAAGIQILDGVFNDFKNLEALEQECLQGRRFGMDGKTLIHPSQIEMCNSIFSPSVEELQAAQRIVEEFAQPENSATNVVSIDGKMVERLHADIAQEVLAKGRALGLI